MLKKKLQKKVQHLDKKVVEGHEVVASPSYFVTEKKGRFGDILIDVVFTFLIVAIGWVLIGFYLEGEYLDTNYQDWIYHAFRAQNIEQQGGVLSWDHVWSNGINHWRSYQYIQHYSILGVAALFGSEIPKAMIIMTVGVFIILRLLLYGVLRKLGVRPIFAYFAVILSYVYAQQWVAISDFSIFISFLILPFYLYLWISLWEKYSIRKEIQIKNRILPEYAFAIATGALWVFHPILGNALAGLFFISIVFRALKINMRYAVGLFGCYCLGALPFFLVYFSSGYHFSNPLFTTLGFIENSITGEYFGLSLYFFAALGAAWVMVLFYAKNIAQWAKILLTYASIYFLVIYLAQNGYIPEFIRQLQISRVIPILAILVAFSFGAILQGVLGQRAHLTRGAIIIFLVVSVVGMSESIRIGTVFTGQPVRHMDDPVSNYFKDKEAPRGSIYARDVSAASYFGAQDLRYVTSYNEHLLPHPLSIRFSFFMRSEIAYTGVPQEQRQLIEDYIAVLGVEYLFLPKESPLVKSLTDAAEGETALFEQIEVIDSRDGQFAVLKITKDINYAYIVDDGAFVWDEGIRTPTVHVNSYKQWDDHITWLAGKMRDGSMEPLNLSFSGKDGLVVDGASVGSDKDILVTQSYDPYWSIAGDSSVVTPSQARFIVIDGERAQKSSGKYEVENRWPAWHWPLQIFGVVSVLMIFAVGWVLLVRKRK